MKKTHSNGILISVEGIDGSGKSTLAASLVTRLAVDHTVIHTREPGGTLTGTAIRSILQIQTEELAPKAEFLLFAADRAQHFATVIEPGLASGALIISDRMADSSLVYQGYARGLDPEMITRINRWAMNDRAPGITIYVSVDVDTAFERIDARNEAKTSFEKREFIERVKNGFDSLYKNRVDVVTIDGSRTPDLVLEQAYTQLLPYLPGRRTI